MHEYIFSKALKDPEYRRLSLIQDSFDEKSKKHLRKSGLKKGLDCMEVGVGTGSLATWMKEEVGEEGSVLAVDLDTRFIQEDAVYTVLEGDFLDLDIKGSFDLIHLRYVLIHNKNATAMISKLYTLLNEGGKLVVEEPDFTLAKWMDAENLDACKRVNNAICKSFENNGLKAHYGSILHLNLKEAGFEIDESLSYLHLCSGREDISTVMALSARALYEAYLGTGACSAEDIESYIHACEDPESLGVYYATVAVIASKKKSSTNEVIGEKEVNNTVPCEGIFQAVEETEILRCFELMHLLRPNLDKESFVQRVKSQMNTGYRLFYMYQESTLVALAGCRLGLNLAWGEHLYIDDLVSAEDKRSQGYGQKILEHLCDFAKENGCKEIHLDSGVQRFGAHKFYLREDFKIASHHFVKGL